MTIEFSNNFLKEAKQLSKKFKLLKNNLKQVSNEIENKIILIAIFSKTDKEKLTNLTDLELLIALKKYMAENENLYIFIEFISILLLWFVGPHQQTIRVK